MKKYLYVVFAFLACLFVSQNVHASSPSYDVLYYGGTLTLDTWDDATYEEELVYYLVGAVVLLFLLKYYNLIHTQIIFPFIALIVSCKE